MTRPVNHRLPVLGPGYRPPATRGECVAGTDLTGSLEQRKQGKQCGAYECRYHLAVVQSSDVPGRRFDGVSPEWTVSGDNISASAPSCALDVADANPAGMSNGDVAEIMGISRRRVEQIVKAWRATNGAVEMYELRASLMENGE